MKNKINIEDLKKLGQLESESAYILNVYEYTVKYKHIKNIACKIGLVVNKYALLTYTLIGIISCIAIKLNTNLIALFSLLLITLFLLDKSHKFYLKESMLRDNHKITIVRNRFSKKNNSNNKRSS